MTRGCEYRNLSPRRETCRAVREAVSEDARGHAYVCACDPRVREPRVLEAIPVKSPEPPESPRGRGNRLLGGLECDESERDRSVP